MKNVLAIILIMSLLACNNETKTTESGAKDTMAVDNKEADALTDAKVVDMGTNGSAEKTVTFTDVDDSDKKETSAIKNYQVFEASVALHCGCLQYVADNGREFHYKATKNNCRVECILSIGGKVTSTSGLIVMNAGDTYVVGLRSGQVHGWVCY